MSWHEDTHVEVLCLRPDQHIAQGSITPALGEALLNAKNAKFASLGASPVGFGMLAWMTAAVMGTMMIV